MGVIKRNAARRYDDAYNSGNTRVDTTPGYVSGSGNRFIDDTPGYVGQRVDTMPKTYQETASKAIEASGNSPTTTNRDSTTASYSRTYSPAVSTAQKPTFSLSDRTQDYYDALDDVETERPDPFQSKYTQQIDSLLNTIQNPQKFDLASDNTYRQLYDNYKESYMAQGNRAMRDAMGQASAMTGGYGSTYAQAAGQQAYDNYLQQLNDKNLELYSMALDDYWRNRNDNYNQLNAVNAQDAVDYGRYRDDISDWQTDRAYYANQAQNGYGNDYSMYQTGLDQYNAERNYDLNNRQFDEQMAYNREKDAQDQANWQTQFDYNKMLDDREWALKMQQLAEAGSGGSGGGGGGGYKRKTKSSDSTKGSGDLGGWAPYTAKISEKLKAGQITQNDAYSELMADLQNEGREYTEKELDEIFDAAGIDWGRLEEENKWALQQALNQHAGLATYREMGDVYNGTLTRADVLAGLEEERKRRNGGI